MQKIFSIFRIISSEKVAEALEGVSLSCRPSSPLPLRTFTTGTRLATFPPATSSFWTTLSRWKSGLASLCSAGGRPITSLATTSRAMSTSIIWVSLQYFGGRRGRNCPAFHFRDFCFSWCSSENYQMFLTGRDSCHVWKAGQSGTAFHGWR